MIERIKDIKYHITEKIKRISLKKKIVFLLAFIIIFIVLLKSLDKRITAMEWFNKQEYYVAVLEEYTTSLDNITTLYINNNISVNDYYNHMTVLRSELDFIIASYNNYKKSHPIKAGTYDYYTKLGCEAVSNSFTEVSNLVDMCLQESVIYDKDKLIYTYLAFSQNISSNMADYMLAYSVINYDNNNGGTKHE